MSSARFVASPLLAATDVTLSIKYNVANVFGSMISARPIAEVRMHCLKLSIVTSLGMLAA